MSKRPRHDHLAFAHPVAAGLFALALLVPAAPVRGESDIVVEPEGAVVPVPPVAPTPGEVDTVPPLPPEMPIIIDTEEGTGRSGIEIRIGEEQIAIRNRGGSSDWAGDGTERVRVGEDVYVARDEYVEGDVVALKGSVYVDGIVEGDVVAIAGDVHVTGEVLSTVVAVLGDVELSSSAVCGGDVVSIGGRVDRDAGQVDGQVYSISVFPGSGGIPALRTAGLVLTAFSFLSYLLFLLVLAVLFAHNTRRMLGDLRLRGPRCLGIGLLLHLGAQIAFALLIVTVIGAPVAFIGWIVWWGIAQTAAVLGGIRFGRALSRADHAAIVLPGLLGGVALHALWVAGFILYPAEDSAAAAVGATLLTVAFALGIVLILAGTGALFGSRFGGRAPAPTLPASSPLGATRSGEASSA